MSYFVYIRVRNALSDCTKKYARARRYVNGLHMLIYWQLMPNDMSREDKWQQIGQASKKLRAGTL
jgi:hypothetical protein